MFDKSNELDSSTHEYLTFEVIYSLIVLCGNSPISSHPGKKKVPIRSYYGDKISDVKITGDKITYFFIFW